MEQQTISLTTTSHLQQSLPATASMTRNANPHTFVRAHCTHTHTSHTRTAPRRVVHGKRCVQHNKKLGTPPPHPTHTNAHTLKPPPRRLPRTPISSLASFAAFLPSGESTQMRYSVEAGSAVTISSARPAGASSPSGPPSDEPITTLAPRSCAFACFWGACVCAWRMGGTRRRVAWPERECGRYGVRPRAVCVSKTDGTAVCARYRMQADRAFNIHGCGRGCFDGTEVTVLRSIDWTGRSTKKKRVLRYHNPRG